MSKVGLFLKRSQFLMSERRGMFLMSEKRGQFLYCVRNMRPVFMLCQIGEASFYVVSEGEANYTHLSVPLVSLPGSTSTLYERHRP